MSDAGAFGKILARGAILAGMAGAVLLLVSLFDRSPERNANPSAQALKDPVTAMARAWNGEVNFSPSYAALNPYAGAAQQKITTRFDPGDEYWGLPRSEGYETVAAWCGACHTLQIVMAQRQSSEGWEYLLRWMVEKQGMAAPPADTHAEIVDYLTREFSEMN